MYSAISRLTNDLTSENNENYEVKAQQTGTKR